MPHLPSGPAGTTATRLPDGSLPRRLPRPGTAAWDALRVVTVAATPRVNFC